MSRNANSHTRQSLLQRVGRIYFAVWSETTTVNGDDGASRYTGDRSFTSAVVHPGLRDLRDCFQDRSQTQWSGDDDISRAETIYCIPFPTFEAVAQAGSRIDFHASVGGEVLVRRGRFRSKIGT